jgi:glycerol-3-phosphate cytidylyltransferase
VSAEKVEIIVSDLDSDVEYQEKHKKICKKFKVRYIYSQTEMAWNISKARNIGIKNASAPYVMTTDVDCVFEPNFLANILTSLNEKTFVCCRVWEISEGYRGKLDDFESMRQVSILRLPYGYGTCQAFPKRWAEKVGGFDELYVTWGAEDKDFNLRAEQDGLSIVWIENKTTYYHQWHLPGNHPEDRDQLAQNRMRCEKTRLKKLPINRNPLGWGKVGHGFGDVAILVTTFIRDEMLFRCIKSIRQFYSEISIFIADNGQPTDEKKEFCKQMNCILVRCPYDCGVSESRNIAFKKIPREIKYVVILEDDCIFTSETNLSVWKKILEKEPNVGIVGGLLKRIDRIQDEREQHYEANISIEDDAYYIRQIDYPQWLEIDKIKYFLCDLVLNIYMMRHEVWDELKYDSQFKSIFEHSDYFLSLKTKTKWKTAYTPDTSIWHVRPTETNMVYLAHRRRTEGKELFAKKWGVEYSWSSFEGSQKQRLIGTNEKKTDIMDENLSFAIGILNKHGCKWWLDAGTCLGAVREKDFIGHDQDIDIGIAGDHLSLWDIFIDEFKKQGFELYKEWIHDGQRMELSFKRKDIKTELFFLFKKDNWCWHGAFGPDENGRWGEHMVFLPHVFSASLFENLKEIVFKGKKCFVPNPPEQYLFERYGSDWKIPKSNFQYWRDGRAIDKNFFKKEKTVFICGVWDYLHHGHLKILESSKALGTKLIVGVLTDEAAMKYKPKPFVPFKERRRIIEALKIVDMVIEQNDSDATEDFKKLGLRPDYIVHGDDWNRYPGEEFIRNYGGKVVFFPYTKDISSTEIKKEIAKQPSTPPLRGNKIAIAIKTFLREKSLFKTINSIKQYFPLPYKLYIADDSGSFISDEKKVFYENLKKAGHEIIELPFDSGISLGRNAILKRLKEEFVLFMDDDILLLDFISIVKMINVFDGNKDIGLVAGMLEHENGEPFGSRHYIRGLRFEWRENVLFRLPASQQIQKANGASYVFADQTVNFFIARRKMFDDVKWDNMIKVEYEHMDFFLSLKKTAWKAAVCLDAKALHVRSENDWRYNQARQSVASQYFLRKNGLSGVINQFQ